MVKTSDDYEKSKNIRVPNAEEWAPFLEATKAMHPEGRSPRTAVLREFIRWYMRRPGAALPKRPDAGPWSTTTEDATAAPEIPAGPVANPRRTKAEPQD